MSERRGVRLQANSKKVNAELSIIQSQAPRALQDVPR